MARARKKLPAVEVPKMPEPIDAGILEAAKARKANMVRIQGFLQEQTKMINDQRQRILELSGTCAVLQDQLGEAVKEIERLRKEAAGSAAAPAAGRARANGAEAALQ